MDIFGIAVLIFLVTDPFGNIAIYIAALKNVAPQRRLRVAGRELLFALVTKRSAPSACRARPPRLPAVSSSS